MVLDGALDKKNSFLDCKQDNFLCLKNPIFPRRKHIVIVREFEFFVISSC